VFKLPRKILIKFILVACAVFLLANSLSCFKDPFNNFFKPQLSLVGWVKREIGGLIFFHRNLIENERLNNEVGALRSRLLDSREVLLENARLRGLLNFKQQSPLRLVPSRVIGRSPDSWSSSIIIDKGKSNGVRRGMVVISLQGLVGRISESSDNSSKVLLINDPASGISSIVQRSRQEGLVSGTLGTNLIMRYLPENADIVLNDTIITSELSQICPKGLLVGKVISLGKELSGLNRYAMIRPAVDLASIEEVLVIIP